MSKLVSIVVPAYNAEDYLAETIESLLAQTYSPLEVIVINDGSTDRTAEVAARFASKVSVQTQCNSGQSKTLNAGWSQSRGEYIGYLSADDLLYPDAITELVAALEADSFSGIVYPDFDLIDASSKKIRAQQAPDFSYREMYGHLVCPPGPGALFRRDVFARAGGWDPSLAQMPDFEFWLRCVRLQPMIRLRKTLAAFRVHEGSQTYQAPSEKKSEEPVRVMQKFFAGENPAEIQQFAAEGLAYGHIFSARLHARASRLSHMLEHLGAAIALRPKLAFDLQVWRHLAGGLFGRLRYRTRAQR